MRNILRKNIGLHFCILFAGILLPSVTQGQNIIYDLAPIQSENSLIRHYVDQVDIIYSYFACDEKGFYYIDRQNNVAYRANLPCSVEVNDMRIFGDNVYFCGSSEDRVIVGWFQINDVFFLGGDITILYFPTMINTQHIMGSDSLSHFSKLKVFKANGVTHLVLVGDGIHTYNNTNGGGSIIVDVWTPDHIIWYFMYTMDYNAIMNYDDIAVTNSYVVITARDNSLQPTVFYYLLPTSAGMTIFDAYGVSPIAAPRYATEYHVLQCSSKLLVTEMTNDEFVTVSEGIIEESAPATIVTYYQDPVTWPLARYAYVTPTTPSGNYDEIVYSKRNYKLYMPKHYDNYIESLGFPFSNVLMYQTVDNYMVMSLDTLDNNGDAVISAIEANSSLIKKVWVLDENNTESCIDVFDIPTKNVVEKRGDQPYNQFLYEDRIIDELLSPDVETIEMNIICE